MFVFPKSELYITFSLAVWNSGKKAGILGQNENYFFNYLPDTPVEHLVSLTMPYRLQSWVSERELHPIFGNSP